MALCPLYPWGQSNGLYYYYCYDCSQNPPTSVMGQDNRTHQTGINCSNILDPIPRSMHLGMPGGGPGPWAGGPGPLAAAAAAGPPGPASRPGTVGAGLIMTGLAKYAAMTTPIIYENMTGAIPVDPNATKRWTRYQLGPQVYFVVLFELEIILGREHAIFYAGQQLAADPGPAYLGQYVGSTHQNNPHHHHHEVYAPDRQGVSRAHTVALHDIG